MVICCQRFLRSIGPLLFHKKRHDWLAFLSHTPSNSEYTAIMTSVKYVKEIRKVRTQSTNVHTSHSSARCHRPMYTQAEPVALCGFRLSASVRTCTLTNIWHTRSLTLTLTSIKVVIITLDLQAAPVSAHPTPERCHLQTHSQAVRVYVDSSWAQAHSLNARWKRAHTLHATCLVVLER